MPPKKRARSPSPNTTTPKKTRGGAINTSGPWTQAEDDTILRLRNSVPATSWADITAAVNKLPPGRRTTAAVKMHYQQVLKYDDQSSGEPLNGKEKELLDRAVKDVESMSDKWWFVAARYAELRKGKWEGESRELGKVGCKKWWNAVKDKGIEEKEDKKEERSRNTTEAAGDEEELAIKGGV
ncbi:hypothetical protein BDD12DRAFT_837692 [Trichophaea hybrida]|nr:hypothetical protein BDD12DRAFT_837692 [Trichophaea hybrida]